MTLHRLVAPRVLLLRQSVSHHPPISERIHRYGIVPSRPYSMDRAMGGMKMRSMSSGGAALKDYDYILAERRFPEGGGGGRGGVGVITLHRPRALNALCDALFVDLIHAIQA
ncbi:hypothetical protein THAOC_13852, partial [Thalassiosira oceanica]